MKTIIKLERNDTVKAVEYIIKEMKWHARSAQEHSDVYDCLTVYDWEDVLESSYYDFKEVVIEMATGYGIDDYEYEYEMNDCEYEDSTDLFEELISAAQYAFDSKGKWTASQVIPKF